ncbi:IS110 family transposase [Chthonobacter rhizosphaerae]|uniref:IS110 family transposase n=1 Tax=Chthonobacter rhizosphaerae TaxID=2735553 RepID=UPI0031B5FBE6
MEARQVKAALSAMPVKTDRNDARGIAQVARTGWFKPVHVKSIDSQQARTLTAARKHVVRSVAAAEHVIRGLLRPFGLKVGVVSQISFAARVRDLVAGRRHVGFDHGAASRRTRGADAGVCPTASPCTEECPR